jgi:hypothetical protein
MSILVRVPTLANTNDLTMSGVLYSFKVFIEDEELKTLLFINNCQELFWYEGKLPKSYNIGDYVSVDYEIKNDQRWVSTISK